MLLIWFLALLIRIAWALMSDHLDPLLIGEPLRGDAASYERIARSLLAGTGYSQYPPAPDVFWPPLFPFFLAVVHLVFGPSVLPIRLVHAVLGALTIIPFFVLARQFLSQRLSYVAALGMALHPFLIYWGNWAIAESLFMLIFVATFVIAARAGKNPSWSMCALLGAAVGLTLLAKPAFLFTVPFLCLWLAGRNPWGSLVHRGARLAIVLSVAGLVIAPWSLRNFLVFGDLVPIAVNGGYTFYGANNPQAFGGHAEGFPPPIPNLSATRVDREYYRRGLAWIAEQPAAWINLLPTKFLRLWSPLSVASSPEPYDLPFAALVYAGYAAFLAVAAVGAAAHRRLSQKDGVLWAPILGTILSTLVFYGDTRYAIPMVPSLLVFFCAGTMVVKSVLNLLWTLPARLSHQNRVARAV